MNEDSPYIQRNFNSPEHARKYALLWLESIDNRISEGSVEDFSPWIEDLKHLYTSPQELMASGEADDLVLRHLEWLAKSSLVTEFDRLGRGKIATGRPTAAEFLFYLFLDAQKCDAIVGDLEERYKLIFKKFGYRRANIWYWSQALRSVWPIMWALGKKAALKPIIGMIAWAVAKGLIGHDSWLAALVEIWKRIRS